VIFRLRDNFGIATAINMGVREAIRINATYVLLSDQDSLPAEHMVANLLTTYDECRKLAFNVGAVGPTFTDMYTKITYPFQVQRPGRFFYGHEAPTSDKPHIDALTLITSGTLIPVSVLQDVGLMREDFFIDQVDIEWCHRARSKGYRLFGTGLATMYQRMGESNLRVWYLGWRYESAYSPLRIYYRIRNFVALCKLDYIDWRWKIRSCWYTTGVVYSHVFFGRCRIKSLKMASIGLWHGITNKMGRYD
jgi:rhamnosyltransferase